MIGTKLIIAAGFIAGVMLAGPVAYLAGDLTGGREARAAAEARAELAAAQGQRDAAHRDLEAAHTVATHAREAAAANGRAAVAAQERIDAYETELQARGANARCLLDDRDVLRLRPAAGTGAAAAKSPAR